MARYRKKPAIIDAVQYRDQIRIDDNLPDGVVICFYKNMPNRDPGDYPTIHTLEGPLLVNDGDWIITGVKGEKYPCKPDIFSLTYEPVTEDEQ